MTILTDRLTAFKRTLTNISLPELGSGSLLVFQSGSFGLRAALFKADKDYATIKAIAESKEVDFTRAIAQIYQSLKKQHGSIPKRCVLISPSLITSTLSLPVNPLKPKAYSDMQELIRWEVEGVSTADNKQWLIGSMLVERGYLTSSQREEIVTELELRQDQGGDAAMSRFGDLAVELGYLSNEQLKECFALQNKLLELDQDVVFGYQAEIPETSLDQEFSGLSDDVLSTDNENPNDYQWLVAGIGRALRKRWCGAFELNGLKLEALYPDNGASFAALGLRSEEAEQFLIEVHPSHLVFIEGSCKNLKVITTQARHDGNLTLDEVLSICPANIANQCSHIYLYSPDDPLDDLSFALAQHLNVEIRPLVQATPNFTLPLGFSSNRLLPFIGIANHFLKFSRIGRICHIAAKDKEPPLWQKMMQPKIMLTTAASAILLAASGFIIWMQTNLTAQEQRLITLEQRWEKESQVKQQYSKIETEYKLLAVQIENIKHELSLNKTLNKYLNNQLLPAINTVPGVLSAIAESINQGVLIEQVELQLDSVIIDGRALKTRNASQFAQQLNEKLKPWHFQVGDTHSTAASNKPEDDVFLDYQMHLEIGRRYFVDETTSPTKNNEPSE